MKRSNFVFKIIIVEYFSRVFRNYNCRMKVNRFIRLCREIQEVDPAAESREPGETV